MNERLKKILKERFGNNIRETEVLESGAVRIRLNTPQQRTGEKGTVFPIHIESIGGRRDELKKRAVNESENEVTFSFSSEAPVPNWWGEAEILSHHPEDANFDRMREVGAILKNHNPAMITGTPLKVWIDEGSRKGYCTERFGSTEIAMTARTEVLVDDSLRGISVGFIVREWILLENVNTSYRGIQGVDGETVWVASKWEALEASHTPIPADPTVGVGRSAGSPGTDDRGEPPAEAALQADENRKLEIKQQEQRMKTLQERAKAVGLREDASEEAVLAAEREAAEKRGRESAQKEYQAELDRQKEIRAIAAEHVDLDLTQEVREAIDGKTPVKDFGDTVRRKLISGKRHVPAHGARTNGSDSQPDLSGFRLSRYILGVMDGGLSGIEREIHEEGQREADNLGLGVGTGYMPSSVIRELGIRAECHRQGKTRASVAVGADTNAGYLVGTENIGLIDALRSRLWMSALGVKMLTGLRNNITLPGIATEGEAEELTEIETMAGADIALDQRTLSPNRVGTQVTFSLQLLRQSSPQIEMVLSDILYGRIARKYNAMGIAFLRALAGVNVVTTGGLALTRTIMRQFKTLIAADNADELPPSWMFNSTVEGKLDTVKVDDGSGKFLYEENAAGEGRVLNRRALTTNLMADTDIFYADFTRLWMGDWGGIDFVRDNVTKAAEGEIVLTANSFIDFAVEHEEHFARATDVNPTA